MSSGRCGDELGALRKDPELQEGHPDSLASADTPRAQVVQTTLV